MGPLRLLLKVGKVAGAVGVVSVALNGLMYRSFARRNLAALDLGPHIVDESQDVLALFDVHKDVDDGGFVFGLATAPAHVEDELDDVWLEFALETVPPTRQKAVASPVFPPYGCASDAVEPSSSGAGVSSGQVERQPMNGQTSPHHANGSSNEGQHRNGLGGAASDNNGNRTYQDSQAIYQAQSEGSATAHKHQGGYMTGPLGKPPRPKEEAPSPKPSGYVTGVKSGSSTDASEGRVEDRTEVRNGAFPTGYVAGPAKSAHHTGNGPTGYVTGEANDLPDRSDETASAASQAGANGRHYLPVEEDVYRVDEEGEDVRQTRRQCSWRSTEDPILSCTDRINMTGKIDPGGKVQKVWRKVQDQVRQQQKKQKKGKLKRQADTEQAWSEEDAWEPNVASFHNIPHPEQRLRFWTDPDTELQLAEGSNCKVFRLGIDWGRVVPCEPVNGTINVIDRGAMQHYRWILERVRAHHMDVMLALFHHSIPKWAIPYGGWKDKRTAIYFCEFAELAVLEFGDLVRWWITFNEPHVFAMLTYCANAWPGATTASPAARAAARRSASADPLSKSAAATATATVSTVAGYPTATSAAAGPSATQIDSAVAAIPAAGTSAVPPPSGPLCTVGGVMEAIGVMRAIKDAHNLAYDVIHQVYRAKGWTAARVGVSHHVSWQRPYGIFDAPLVALSEVLTRFAFVDAVCKKCDFLGVNYYGQEFVSGTGLKLVTNVEYSDAGRGVYPDGLYRALLLFHQRYNTDRKLNLPFFITENGVADSTDYIRRPYIVEHLLAVQAAMKKVRCKPNSCGQQSLDPVNNFWGGSGTYWTYWDIAAALCCVLGLKLSAAYTF